MGIKNINEIVKEKCPKAFTSVRLVALKNKYIAIDSAIWFYANMAIAQRETVRKMKDIFEEIDRGELLQYCISAALKFYTNFLENEIYCVWIKDGETPKEKKDTRAKRKETRDKRKNTIEELREKILEEDILLRNQKDVEELRKMMMYDVTVYPEEYTNFYNALNGMGIPLLTAPAEAEAYACSLNKKGIVYGIWTTDTDCYALGGVNMITGMDGKDKEGFEMLSVVHIPYIRKYLDMDEDELRDLCIMCGTDFNDNIPNVGVTRAYNAIEEFRCIEEYAEQKDKDIKILNHKKVRKLLTPPDCDLTIDSSILKFNVQNFKDNGKDLSVQFGLSNFYDKLKHLYSLEIDVTKYNIKTGPHIKKKKILIEINGEFVDLSKEKEKKQLKYDDTIFTMDDLKKSLETLE
jgi:flap endonuclease-1